MSAVLCGPKHNGVANLREIYTVQCIYLSNRLITKGIFPECPLFPGTFPGEDSSRRNTTVAVHPVVETFNQSPSHRLKYNNIPVGIIVRINNDCLYTSDDQHVFTAVRVHRYTQ